MLSYKKPAFWIIIAAIVVAAALAVFLLTSPKNSGGGDAQSGGTQTDGGASGEAQSDDLPTDWALCEDYSQKKAIGAVEYRLAKENESAADRRAYDGTVAAWVDVDGGFRFFYLTITENRRSLYEEPRSIYENIVYADAFAVDCAALKLTYPDGGDPLSAATRDTEDIVPGYANVILDGRTFEIVVRDGHIVLSDGETELLPVVSRGELPAPISAADSVPREVWYCESPIVDSVYNDRAVLTLYPQEKRYALELGLISSYIGSGKYTDDGGTVVCSDGTYTYTFVQRGGALGYDEERSDGPTYDALADGALFRRDLYLDSIYSFYDAAAFDINGDGENERVTLGMGMTSGVFSFTLNATTAYGEYVCGGAFVTRHYVSLRFAEADGERVIEATDSDGNVERYHFRASGSVVELTDENGEPVKALG